jgi:hypothetical protein
VFTVKTNPTPLDLRKFAHAMFIGFGFLGAVLWLGPVLLGWWRGQTVGSLGWSGTRNQWTALFLWGTGLLTGGLSIASPRIAKPLYVTWMRITMPIGFVMSTVMLTLMFLLILPPFVLIVRWTDPLRRRITKQPTYWEDYKPHEPTLERMRRPF